MKVLHIVPLISTEAEYGGPARGTLRQADIQDKSGMQSDVLSIWRGRKPERAMNVRSQLVTFPARHIPGSHQFGGLISVRALTWLLFHARTYDVVHFHAGRELWALMAMIICRLLKVRYVTQTHGMLAPRSSFSRKLYDRMVTSVAYRGSSNCLYLTNYERRDLEAFNWFGRLTRILNGVDEVATSLPPAAFGSRLQVVTTTRLHPRKRVSDLVRAVCSVRESGLEIELAIFGRDEGDLERIMRTIKESASGDYISYGGTLSYSDISSALTASNIYVLPSIAEPFPNSLLEGLANGLACICTTQCGLAPFIEEWDAGIVVEPTAEAIAVALRELQSPTTRQRLGKNALRMCREVFSMEAVAASLYQAYAPPVTASTGPKEI